MNNDIPLSSYERYLAKAAGADVELPPFPTSRREQYWAAIVLGTTDGIPAAPTSNEERYLAAIAHGSSAGIPAAPTSRKEQYLAAIALGTDDGIPDFPTSREEYFLAAILSSGGGTITTITGVSPLTLANALAKPIRSLIQYGKCTQSGTPTPSVPVDIVCNNGALRMVDDELPAAYKRVLGYECNNDSMWEITGFRLKGSDTVRISFEISDACNVFGCYQGATANDNYDLYVSTSSGSKYFRYGNGTYASYFSSSNRNKRFDVVYTPNGSQGMPEDSTWNPMTFTSANDLLIGSTTLTGSSAKLKGKLYGNFEVDGRLKLIPCERVSDGVLGYYDTYGATFYEPYEGFDGATSLGYDGSHYTLGVVGTPEVLTVSADGAATQTVTNLPMLLSVGDYKDEAEIISGGQVHKVWVKVLTSADVRSFSNGCFFVDVPEKKKEKSLCLCTHFVFDSGSSSGISDGQFGCASTTRNFYFKDSNISDIDEAKTFVDDQFAAGTPIIVLYPLDEETTEQTTAHSLHSYEGSTIVEADTNVDPVTLSAEYAASEEDET